ncbi:PREDICTED: thaumatin-like protein [Camelina sativa]|uniref:Thaumatin-like protein n=1 Tax=Camelina sativa TaxID=90675 RepID=A0ABM0U542_CAMSA|nr:PREDICTED: thaumatin-like protein [Camelina sativa]
MKVYSTSLLQLFIISSCIVYGKVTSHEVTFYVQNKCSFPIWPAVAPNSGHPVLASGGFYLPCGGIEHIDAPWGWSGRIWARTGCDFTSNWKQACETGDCDGHLECNGLIGKPPATLIQIAVQADKFKPNFYDVSLVDGYNLPVAVNSKPISSKCAISGCHKDLKTTCPEELQVLNEEGRIVACKSACLAFDNDRFCCRNAYGTPGKCKRNMYSMLFKEACPNYYSYAYDTPPPLVTCSAKEYLITFCPSSWGHSST